MKLKLWHTPDGRRVWRAIAYAGETPVLDSKGRQEIGDTDKRIPGLKTKTKVKHEVSVQIKATSK